MNLRRFMSPLMPLCLSLAVSGAASVHADQVVYTDTLQNNWQNWSWAVVSLAATNPVHSGADSISVTAASYSALYLHHDPQASEAGDSLTFWIDGGPTGGQSLQVQATLSGSPQKAYALPMLSANTWVKITIPLSALGVAGNAAFDGFWLQDTSGKSAVSVFYIDDIGLSTASTPPAGPVVIKVDANANRHPISPLIYGVAYADTASLADLNAPLNRLGGNNTSRYNWNLDADNKASDYFFESIGDTPVGQTVVPGKRGDTFIAASKAGGAQAMLTIPNIGWVAKLTPNGDKLASFSVAKYGRQQSTDPYMPDAGSGILPSGAFVTGNDPNDANLPNSADLEGGWISHLTAKWGTASKGGLSYYLMDNEPSIWFGTHRDVHPVGPTMDEIKNDILTYGAKVKALDPSANVVGPEEWGWSGYFYSGYDQQYLQAHNYQGHPDRDTHGGMDYLPWLLDQLHQNDLATGKRLLDVFSVHFYPQSGEFSNAADSKTALLRNRSTRQLWDPNYTSESWIGDKVMLIPRIKNWVNTYYPGTKTALTEYNWGAEGDMNGATTQADIDGIFGREGLGLATRWTTPAAGSPVYLAMKLYRNYDGHKSGFGDLAVSDTAPDPDTVSSFASVRSSDGALTVTVINKGLSASVPVTVLVANFASSGSAQAWQLAGGALTRLADVSVASGAIALTVPAESVTLFVVPAVPATQKLAASAASAVRAAQYADTNYGTSKTFVCKRLTSDATSAYNWADYLKFDLSGVRSAPKQATLTLTVNPISRPYRSFETIKLYSVVDTSWTESALTWNNAPGLNRANFSSAGTLLSALSVPLAPGTVSFDVTPYVQANWGKVVSFQLLDGAITGNLVAFDSRTAVSGSPLLTVKY